MKWVLASLVALSITMVDTPDTNSKLMTAKYTNEHSRFLDAPEGRVHYRDQGPRNAPVLLLLHGSSSSLNTWEPVVARLGDRNRLISFNLPGHGLTGPSKSRYHRDGKMVKSATTVLDALAVKRATWVGSSMGGWVAWRAGLSVTDRVDGLVLIGAVGAQTGNEFKRYPGARIAKSWLGEQLFPHITPEWMVRASVEESMANPAQVKDAVVARYSELLRSSGNRQALVDREHTGREEAAWSRIGSLDMPVLPIWGSEDRIVPLAFGREFEKAIKNSTLLVIDRTGHLPMEERPDDVVKSIGDWKTISSNRKEPKFRTTFVPLAMGPVLPMSAVSSRPAQRQFDGMWTHCSQYQGDDVCSYIMLAQHDARLCGLWGYWASGRIYEGRLRGKVTGNIAQVEQICGRPGSETSVECARKQGAQQVWQRSDKTMFICKSRLYESNVGLTASCNGTSNAAGLTKAMGRMRSKVMAYPGEKTWLEACVKSSGIN